MSRYIIMNFGKKKGLHWINAYKQFDSGSRMFYVSKIPTKILARIVLEIKSWSIKEPKPPKGE
jgi:hypothetical protein